MAVPQRGHKGAAKPTSLLGGISSTDLAFSVATGGGTGYPDGSDGVFVILVDGVLSGAEKILCSARTGDAFTVAPGGRGYDDTAASAHLNNASVAHTNSAVEAAEANAHILATTGVHGIADTSALLTTAAGNAAYPSLANFTALRFSSAFTSTSESTASTTYTALTTATSVDVTAPASGRVLVQWNVQQQAAANFALSTVLVTVVAGGATFFDGGDAYAAQNAVSNVSSVAGQMPLTGLTPGTTYRFAMRHRVSAGTGTFQSRNLVVLPQA